MYDNNRNEPAEDSLLLVARLHDEASSSSQLVELASSCKRDITKLLVIHQFLAHVYFLRIASLMYRYFSQLLRAWASIPECSIYRQTLERLANYLGGLDGV